MGYVHDTQMSQYIPAACIQKTAGTWTTTISSNTVGDVRSAAAAAFTLIIPIIIPSNAAAYKGARLKSIDVCYKIATKDATDFATVELEKQAFPADTVAVSAAAVAVTLDANHNTAAKRYAQGSHTMTVALNTPAWIDDNDVYLLQLVVSAADTTVFTLWGARANFDLRV